jgi:predicted Zn finger-like uncharacterized protein
MAETHITRCPHCQTTFRIRLEQLAAAKGAVRCGSCLQVFKAADHLDSDTPKAATPSVAKPTATKPVIAKPAAAKPAAAKPTVAKPTVAKPTVAKPTEPKKEAAVKKVEPAAIEVEEISFDDIPDQIADDPLEDFGIRQPDRDSGETFENSLQLDDSVFSMQEGTKPSRYSLLDQGDDVGFDLNDDFADDNFGNNNDNSDDSWASSLIEDEQSSSLKPTADDESWADALLDVDEDLIEDIDMSFTKANVAKEEDDFIPSLEDDSEVDQFHLGGDDHLDQETVEIDLSISDSVNDLLDEPLNFENKGKKKAPIAKGPNFLWLWLTGALVMSLALIAQIGFFKFDSWSRHPDYRPAYAIACQVIGCQLPAIQDISKMDTQHFMVRLHPKIKQALYIDTLLINTAEYQQPFPDLRLIFTGLDDQTIASRRFKPSDYLAGELSGASIMPLRVPIHIAFEIVNPGAEAVGYRIELAANH